MSYQRLFKNVKRGLPYLAKEVRLQITKHTPFFVCRPQIVHLWRQGPCNGRCIMCWWGFSSPVQREAWLEKSFPTDAIPRILSQIGDLCGSGTMVSYMSGEPLLSPAVFDWLKMAADLGLDFRFTTNGYLLDEERARKLVASKPFNIGVSLESLDPVINETLRPVKDGTRKTVQGIELLIAERKKQNSSMSINIKCTLTQINFRSLADIIRRFGQIEGVFITPQVFEVIPEMPPETVDKLWIRDLDGLKATVQEVIALKKAGYAVNVEESVLWGFVRQYEEDPQHVSTISDRKVKSSRGVPCSIGNSTLFIMSDGGVRLCPHFPAIGNVMTDSATLKQMWYSDTARDVRRQIAECRWLCNLSCLRQTSLLHKIKTFLRM